MGVVVVSGVVAVAVEATAAATVVLLHVCSFHSEVPFQILYVKHVILWQAICTDANCN